MKIYTITTNLKNDDKICGYTIVAETKVEAFEVVQQNTSNKENWNLKNIEFHSEYYGDCNESFILSVDERNDIEETENIETENLIIGKTITAFETIDVSDKGDSFVKLTFSDDTQAIIFSESLMAKQRTGLGKIHITNKDFVIAAVESLKEVGVADINQLKIKPEYFNAVMGKVDPNHMFESKVKRLKEFIAEGRTFKFIESEIKHLKLTDKITCLNINDKAELFSINNFYKTDLTKL